MYTVQPETQTWTGFGMRDRALNAVVRLLRLAGMSAVLGLLAGAGAHVRAQTQQVASDTVPASPATASQEATSSAPAQAQPEPLYEVLPGELMQTQPTVIVVAQSSVPSKSAPVAVAGGKKNKKIKKEKPPKLVPVHIEQGTLTVDGWTGKAQLDYEIADLKYIYVWAPGIGTVVVSNQKFPLGTEQKAAFNRNTLTVDAKGHQIQITSDKDLLKDKKPASAWVYLDAVYKAKSVFPEMGYGSTNDAPYAWPGAKQEPAQKAGLVAAPPLPAGMRPMLAKATCLPASAAGTAGVRAAPGACPVTPAKTTASAGPLAPVPPGAPSATATAQVSPATPPAAQ